MIMTAVMMLCHLNMQEHMWRVLTLVTICNIIVFFVILNAIFLYKVKSYTPFRYPQVCIFGGIFLNLGTISDFFKVCNHLALKSVRKKYFKLVKPMVM